MTLQTRLNNKENDRPKLQKDQKPRHGACR